MEYEKMRAASKSLSEHLRSIYSDPMNPWFAVGIRKDSLCIHYNDRKPTNITEWEGVPVTYMQTGIPSIDW